MVAKKSTKQEALRNRVYCKFGPTWKNIHRNLVIFRIVVQYSLGNAYLQDARKEFSEVKRKETKDLQFRISGLPIDVNNQELHSELDKLVF